MMSGTKKILSLDCSACKSPQSMNPQKIYRMSGIVVFIGYLIALPSVIGVIISIVLFVASVQAGAEVSSLTPATAPAVGAAIGTTIGVGLSLFTAAVSLIGGTIGYLLIMKKKVFKCVSCGFLLDRH